MSGNREPHLAFTLEIFSKNSSLLDSALLSKRAAEGEEVGIKDAAYAI